MVLCTYGITPALHTNSYATSGVLLRILLALPPIPYILVAAA